MTRHRRWWLGAAVVCALALLGLAFVVQGSYAQDLPPAPGAPLEDEGLLEAPLSSAHFQLSWNRIATGGGPANSSHFKINATIGQPAAGNESSSHYKACTGFWCEAIETIRRLFLPFTVKSGG